MRGLEDKRLQEFIVVAQLLYESNVHKLDKLFDAENTLHQAMAKRLREYKKALVSHYRESSELPLPDEEEVKALRAMGYIQ